MMSKQNPSLYNGSQKVTQTQNSMQIRSNAKVLFILFFGVNVLFTMNFLPRDQTINKEMKCPREAVRR